MNTFTKTMKRFQATAAVIRKRYPNMAEEDVMRKASAMMPTSMSNIEVIDPNSFSSNW